MASFSSATLATAIVPMTTPSQNFPVVIIGAGPAGATASLFLSEQGIAHAIVDKAEFPRDKVDGNFFGNKVLGVLGQVRQGKVRRELLNSPHMLRCDGGLRLVSTQGSSFGMNWAGGDAGLGSDVFTMARLHFDQVLVNHLESSHATVHLGTAITGLKRDKDGIELTVETPDGEQRWRSQYILGADGEQSIVRRVLSSQPERPEEDRANTLHAYYSGVIDDRDRPYSAAYLVPGQSRCFVYVVPLAGGTHKVGFIGLPGFDGTKLERLLDETLATHSALSKRFAQAKRIGDVGIWPASHNQPPLDNLSGDRFLLLGDAGSLLVPHVGFGTGNAILSGKLAAETITAAIAANRSDAEFLERYNASLRNNIQTSIKAGIWLKRMARYPRTMNWFIEQSKIRQVFKFLLGKKGDTGLKWI
ncbi:MAG: FAD-dependent monooxygenase [Cyanobacteria bacterium P01_D01_bin.73]